MKRVLLTVSFILAAGQALASPIGVWKVADGTADVRITRCGRNLCGSANGKPVLKAMRQVEKNKWVGTIVDARSGENYDGAISMIANDALKVHGCVPGGGFCGDETWTRVR